MTPAPREFQLPNGNRVTVTLVRKAGTTRNYALEVLGVHVAMLTRKGSSRTFHAVATFAPVGSGFRELRAATLEAAAVDVGMDGLSWYFATRNRDDLTE